MISAKAEAREGETMTSKKETEKPKNEKQETTNEQQKTGTSLAAQGSAQGGTQVQNLNLNPFEEYASQVAQSRLVGQLLKFSKGDYLAGQDGEEIPAGRKLVANMDQLALGWIKWVDNKPEQQLMGLLVEGFQAAKRADLGDTDEAVWEIDSQGKARDPWQFSNYLLMKEVGKNADVENCYTFVTSSRGGLQAIGNVCREFGKEMRKRPDEYPIIELGVDSYNHPNKEFGRIKVPVLKIVGWEKKDLFKEGSAVPAAEKAA